MLEEEKENFDPSDEEDEDENSSTEDEEEDGEEEDEESEEDGEDKGSTEPSAEELKAENEKLRKERDNYKTGLLSHKAKSRPLPFSGEQSQTHEEPKEKKEAPKTDEVETRVLNALSREAERRAMRSVIDPDSSNYIGELENSEDYLEIIQYLPKNADRTTESGVVRALRVATSAWKFDRGFTTQKDGKKKNKTLATETSSTSSGQSANTKHIKGERKFLKKNVPPSEWYK